MNERQIKSLVGILKTTVKALEDELQTNHHRDEPQFKVDYSDILTYYARDYDDNGESTLWD